MQFSLSKLSLLLVLCCATCFAQVFYPLEINGEKLTKIELAYGREACARGLMYRTELPVDGGMLFVFDRPRVLNFWMRNTLIPLDVVFIDRDGIVTAVHTMYVERAQQENERVSEYCERLATYSSYRPAVMALELNAGMARQLNIKIGDKLKISWKQLLIYLN